MTVHETLSLLNASDTSSRIHSEKGFPLCSRNTPSLSSHSNLLSGSPRFCLCSPTSHPGSFRCRLHRVQQTRSSKSKITSSVSIRKPILGKSKLSNGICSASMYNEQNSSYDSQRNPLRFLQLASAAGLPGVAIKTGLEWAKKHNKSDSRLSIANIKDLPHGAIHAGIGKGSHVYIVQKGDTLYHIATEFGTTVEILIEANGLKSDLISPGEHLWVPQTYTIQKGDTLFKIAQKNGTSILDILKINNIQDPNLIYPGDVLLLP